MKNPGLLNRFLTLTFADLKVKQNSNCFFLLCTRFLSFVNCKKKYKFHYWFAFPALLFDAMVVKTTSSALLGEKFSATQVVSLRTHFASGGAPAYFLYRVKGDLIETTSDLSQWSSFLADTSFSSSQGTGGIGFADSSALPSNPGWPLRNLLVLVARHLKCDSINGGVQFLKTFVL